MTALELILQLAEGSTTPNTLQHIAKIARETIEALKAQPQQEPVAFEIRAFNATQALIKRADVAQEKADVLERGFGSEADVTIVPLYISPPAQRTWVGLTDEMVVAAARMLSDRQAAACNVDCGDMWKLHGNDFLEDARAALEAAHGIKGEA